MTADVTPFPGSGELPENLLQVEPRQPGYCSHDTLRVNLHARTIACSHCGAVLDAFDYVAQNAQHMARAWQMHDNVKHQVDELQNRLTALKAEEKRLRDRVKRLKEKEDGVVVVKRRP